MLVGGVSEYWINTCKTLTLEKNKWCTYSRVERMI
jgi:hypothetical protein